MFYFTLFLYLWLAIGFLTAFKSIFVDQMLKEGSPLYDTYEGRMLKDFTMKYWWVFFLIITFLGPVAPAIAIRSKIQLWRAKRAYLKLKKLEEEHESGEGEKK